MKNHILTILGLVFVLALVIAVGCAPKSPYQVVPIAGNAYYAGKPIPAGFRLDFYPEGGTRGSVGIIKGNDGGFTAIHSADQDGVVTGKCKVNVTLANALNDTASEELAPMIAKYGFGTDGIPIEITKKNMKLKIEFPKAD